jgi:hypothetical protein
MGKQGQSCGTGPTQAQRFSVSREIHSVFTLRSLFACAVLSVACMAQQTQIPNVESQRSAMRKLDFLVGSWSGEARILPRSGEPLEMVQTEEAQYKLDGLVLVIEGIGRNKSDGKTTLQALGIISYDDEGRTICVHITTAATWRPRLSWPMRARESPGFCRGRYQDQFQTANQRKGRLDRADQNDHRFSTATRIHGAEGEPATLSSSGKIMNFRDFVRGQATLRCTRKIELKDFYTPHK